MSKARLVFVYNADSGLFNTLTDIAHKAFSPQTYQCNLCAITHDLLSEKSDWKDFVATLPTDMEFLHRDEFYKAYDSQDTDFPAVYLLSDESLSLAIPADELNAVQTVDELKQRVSKLVL